MTTGGPRPRAPRWSRGASTLAALLVLATTLVLGRAAPASAAPAPVTAPVPVCGAVPNPGAPDALYYTEDVPVGVLQSQGCAMQGAWRQLNEDRYEYDIKDHEWTPGWVTITPSSPVVDIDPTSGLGDVTFSAASGTQTMVWHASHWPSGEPWPDADLYVKYHDTGIWTYQNVLWRTDVNGPWQSTYGVRVAPVKDSDCQDVKDAYTGVCPMRVFVSPTTSYTNEQGKFVTGPNPVLTKPAQVVVRLGTHSVCESPNRCFPTYPHNDLNIDPNYTEQFATPVPPHMKAQYQMVSLMTKPARGLEISDVTYSPTQPKQGDDVTIDVAVTSKGLATQNVKVQAPTIEPEGRVTIDEGPTPATLTIGAGETKHVTFKGVANEKGTATLGFDVTGKNADGDVTAHRTSQLVIDGETGLRVTMSTKDDPIKLEQTDDGTVKAKDVELKIEVENVTDEKITDVTATPLSLFAADPLHPYTFFPAEVLANGDEDLGDLAAHAKKTYTRTLRLTGDGRVVIKGLVLSSDGTTRAEGRIKMTQPKLLKLVAHSTSDSDKITVKAGGRIPIYGSFENLSNDTTVSLPKMMKPLTTGNVGGGYYGVDDGDEVPTPFGGDIAPREKKGFVVRLRTMRPSAEDFFSGMNADEMWTKGEIAFLPPWAEVTGDDGKPKVLLDATVTVDTSYHVTVDTSEPPPSDPFRFENAVIGLGGAGLERVQEVLDSYFAVIGNVVVFGFDEQYRTETMGTMARSVEYLYNVLHDLGPDDMAKLTNEVVAKLTPILTGETSESIRAAVSAYSTKVQMAWQYGDQSAIFDAVRPIGRGTGDLAGTILLDEAVGRTVIKLVSARALYREAATFGELQRKEKIFDKSKSSFPTLEDYYQARTEVPREVVADYMTSTEMAQAESLDRAGIQSVAKPNEVSATRLVEGQLAARKHEEIKNKTMAEIEKLVFGGGDDVGKVLLRADMPATEAEVDALFQKALGENPDFLKPEDIASAKQIWKNRNKEWAGFNSGDLSTEFGRLKQWATKGKIPFEFQAVENGVNLRKHFGYFDFALEEGVDAAGKKIPNYWVLKMRDPITGKMMAISGDVDFLFFISKNGLSISQGLREQVYKGLLPFLTFLHPETGSFATLLKKKLSFLTAHFRDGVPLLTVKDGKWFAVKIDERFTRFRPGTTDQYYLHLAGMPTNFTMLQYLAPFTWAESKAKFPAWLPITALRKVLNPGGPGNGGGGGSGGGSGSGGAGGPLSSDVKYVAAAGIYRATEAGVQRWTAATGWQDDPGATQQVQDGTLVLAPQTAVSTDAHTGDGRVEIVPQEDAGIAGAWFAVGDQVILDPGGPNEEIATVSGFGSLIFTQPLAKPHVAGELVAQLHPAAAAVPAAAETTTTTTTEPAAEQEVAATPVTTTTGALPQTGADVWGPATLGLGLVVGGVALLVGRRRERR